MKSVGVIFVCHNDEAIKRVLRYPYRIIVVGNKPINAVYRDYPNLIIARDLPYNIEHEHQLLTFTAWYAIIKNKLWTEFSHLCILEYDVTLTNDFYEKILYTINTYDVPSLSFIPNGNDSLYWDIDMNVCKNYLRNKNIPPDIVTTIQSWGTSTNQCIRRDVLSDFVDWYYPSCLYIKSQHQPKFSYYHERVYAIYLIHQNLKYYFLNDILQHVGERSHGT